MAIALAAMRQNRVRREHERLPNIAGANYQVRLTRSCTVQLVCRSLGLMLLLALPAVVLCQKPMEGPDPSYNSPNSGTISREGLSDTYGRIDPVAEARREQMQRIAIRQSMESDSAKLLQLAQELDEEIVKTGPDTLTQSELKRYVEIGKLAHKLKSEMRDIHGSDAANLPPAVPVQAPDAGSSHKH